MFLENLKEKKFKIYIERNEYEKKPNKKKQLVNFIVKYI